MTKQKEIKRTLWLLAKIKMLAYSDYNYKTLMEKTEHFTKKTLPNALVGEFKIYADIMRQEYCFLLHMLTDKTL